MDRTLRAALMALLIGVVVIGGTGVFLGVDPGPSLVAGVVTGVLVGGLVMAAARRSASFDDPNDPNDTR